jgi:hypothetical protein
VSHRQANAPQDFFCEIFKNRTILRQGKTLIIDGRHGTHGANSEKGCLFKSVAANRNVFKRFANPLECNVVYQ